MSNPRSTRSVFSLAVRIMVASSMMTGAAFAATATVPAAASVRVDAYIGLWEGVDSLDGSVVRLSLSDVNDDGIIEVTQTESFYSFCHSMGSAFSLGHGVEVGTATVARNRDALKLDLQLICIDDDNGKHERSPVSLEYPLRSRGRNLVIPAFPNSLPIVLHRLAQ